MRHIDPGLFGDSFALIATRASGAGSEFERAAAQLGIPLTVVALDDDESLEATSVLVRPDRFVAWLDDGTEFEAEIVLSHSSGL